MDKKEKCEFCVEESGKYCIQVEKKTLEEWRVGNGGNDRKVRTQGHTKFEDCLKDKYKIKKKDLEPVEVEGILVYRPAISK